MNKLFKMTTVFALLALGITSSYAGPKAGRLEIGGNSNFLLQLMDDEETDFDRTGWGEEEKDTFEYSFDINANYYLTDNISIGAGIFYEYFNEEFKEIDGNGFVDDHTEETGNNLGLVSRADYYLNTDTRVVPYAGVHLGFVVGTWEQKDKVFGRKVEIDYDGFLYGVQAGVKFFLTDSIALDCGLTYSIRQLDGSLDGTWSGSSDMDMDAESLEATVGISIFF